MFSIDMIDIVSDYFSRLTTVKNGIKFVAQSH